MERLTERMNDEINGVWVKEHDYISAAHRLADYEDTGLTPGEMLCIDLLLKDAADLIEQQAARIKELETEARRYATKDDHATLRRVTRAVNDIATWLRAKIESERRDLAELESYGVPPIYSPVGVISDAKEVLTRLEACLSETGLCDKEKKEENVRNG